jgi:4-hydroxy-tetrahydrodipicolinate synthase
MSGRFGSVLTAMVTPFDDDLRLDLDAAAELARWLAGHGSDGLVVAGTTGEGAVLDDAEKLDLFRAVAEAVTVPVIAGTGSNDTRHRIELTQAAAGTGVDAVLAVTPYYNRPSQAGIEGHVRAIAGASDLPVMLYDVPFRTGRKIEAETILRLAREVPTVVAHKDAGGDPAATAGVVAGAPGGFEVYSGDDKLTLSLLAVGAVGVVGVGTHWCGELVAEMIAAFSKGDVEAARAVNARLLESWAWQSSDAAPSPLPTKAAMRALGLRVGDARGPMGPSPDWLDEQAKAVVGRVRGSR